MTEKATLEATVGADAGHQNEDTRSGQNAAPKRMQCDHLRSVCQYRLFKPRPASERELLRASIQEKGVIVPLIADETLAIL